MKYIYLVTEAEATELHNGTYKYYYTDYNNVTPCSSYKRAKEWVKFLIKDFTDSLADPSPEVDEWWIDKQPTKRNENELSTIECAHVIITYTSNNNYKCVKVISMARKALLP